MNPLLQIKQLHKSFGQVPVLKGVGLDLREGEIHCLVGANGSGKSTLIKCLTGAHGFSKGEILLNSHPVRMTSPKEALRHGLAVIYQEIDLVPCLSIAANMTLGLEGARFFRCKGRERRAASEALSKLGLSFDVSMQVSCFSMGDQQLIAIAKALLVRSRILVMDEPTSALSAVEVDRLFGYLKQLKAAGLAIFYITQRLDEIQKLGDRVTVLRDGRVAGVFPCSSVTAETLAASMVGHALQKPLYPPRPVHQPSGETVLSVRNLILKGILNEISLDIRASEIVGIAGFVGSGRSELLRALFGLLKPFSGDVFIHDRLVSIKTPRMARKLGIGMVPEDRKRQGLQLLASLQDNITFNALHKLQRALCLKRKAQRDMAQSRSSQLGVRPSVMAQPVHMLSGGNQQKVLLGNWFFDGYGVLLLDEPTRGVDVETKSDIYRIVRTWADRGVAMLLVSSELPELLGLCDRILVLCGGRAVACLNNHEGVTEQALLAHMVGNR